MSGEYVTGAGGGAGEHGTVGGSNTYSVGGGWIVPYDIDGSAPVVIVGGGGGVSG